MNEFLMGIFNTIYAKVLGQYWFYFILALFMGINAVRSRINSKEAWRYEVVTIFSLGLSAILWQLAR